ncbi:MAG: pyruvate, phosphate dikinase, partial [Leptospiraceae bacterium]|nr:pyruvate, phosphate dikinase [Leptospiraceae bacterium]
CGDIEINYKEKSMKVGDLTLKEGDDISIDGFVGEVINGHIDSRPSSVVRRYLHGETVQGSQSLVIFDKIMEWADHFREIKVYTNADLPEQCKQAIAFGAQGVGLCRTEHMFFGEDRINVVRSMILARTDEARNHALSKLLEMQREDFLGIFSVMDGKAVTIRCIDPPLHEFLPHTDAEIEDVAKELQQSPEEVKHAVEDYQEFNPMLGMR